MSSAGCSLASQNSSVTRSWAFKGGTCLRKCWFETYRFSEDLDFTVPEVHLDVASLHSAFREIADWVHTQCGLRLVLDEGSFRERTNKRGNLTIEGRIAYIGPLGMPTPPKVKLDLTADEAIVRPLERRPVSHPFSDVGSGRSTAHLADVPMELIRFAGANRLRVTVDYAAKEGRRGSRTVEPYSLRRSWGGDLLLFVLNDRRQLRAYRVDRILGVRIESETFDPRYRVEF